ncbi:MAG: tetratricopeptide repeat protein [Candidatus Omnitrophica bacterium]|nr:tetratricopeptide repeat protein [Candidatus Omnitrophota bacterium]
MSADKKNRLAQIKKRFGIVFLILFMGMSPLYAQGVSSEMPLQLFVKAGFAYKEGRYEEAVKAYEEILAQGQENGALYYNLGNAYFKQDKLGKAVLNYERAKRLIPRDADLNANKRYAQSLVKYYQKPAASSVWGRVVQNQFGVFALDELAWITFGLFVVAAIFILLALYLSWPKRNMMMALICVAILFAVCFGGFITKMQDQKGLGVVMSDVDARFEPRDEGTVHFELYEGSKVKAVTTQGGWVKVERLDGKAGWVLKDTIEKI